MEARIFRAILLAAVLFCTMGAKVRSPNFIIDTPNPQLAQEFCKAAEKYRRDLAVEWLGKPMPNWSRPCPITITVGDNLGAGGETTFMFDRGEVFGWRMSIQGSAQRVLDSVLPHEITHMIFASHFRQPLPRWADEGGATSVEHSSERMKHRRMLDKFLRTGRGIAFNRMFAMTEYPRDVMPLYAQGYSLADYLIQSGGRRKYVAFVGDGLKTDDWNGAVRRNYGTKDLGQLQQTWLAWVKQGSPAIRPAAPEAGASPTMIAAAPTRPSPRVLAQNDPAKLAALSSPAPRRQRPEPNLIYREPASLAHNDAPAHSYAPGGTVPAEEFVGWGTKAKTSNPAESRAVPVGSLASAAPQDLPATGWHSPGESPRTVSPPRPPANVLTDPFREHTQVSRPQPIERPRQIILEWSGPMR